MLSSISPPEPSTSSLKGVSVVEDVVDSVVGAAVVGFEDEATSAGSSASDDAVDKSDAIAKS